ncbi:hypothetical protein WR25_13390 [Diploscapter pachys]|uniref:Uncharacterized protein n=1 Tax=Diploscapter pachys TaxID=2018661 RepID=A0A2A2J3L5_9BILA|nr:hypothetical protein WR25_13390 [Diploscapter pachys]
MAILAIIELDTRFHVQNQQNAKGATFRPDHVFIFKIRAKQMKRTKGRIEGRRGAGKREERGEERKKAGRRQRKSGMNAVKKDCGSTVYERMDKSMSLRLLQVIIIFC